MAFGIGSHRELPQISQGAQGAEGGKASETLESFRAAYCQDVSKEEMDTMLEDGETLLANMKEASKDPKTWETFLNQTPPLNERSAICMMWVLMKKVSVQEGEVFTRGAIRIGKGVGQDGGEDAKKLEQFFLACGGAKFSPGLDGSLVSEGGKAYGRISTHMKESQAEGFAQYGLDLPPHTIGESALPAQRGTVLFGTLRDGTFYCKMEEFGVPPFWKRGHRTQKDFTQFAGHTMNFMKSLGPIAKIAKKVVAGAPKARKESVPKKMKKIFENFVKENKILLSPEELRIGKKEGMTTMIALIRNKNARLAKQFETELQKDRKVPEGYRGDIKGDEVLLPSLFL